MKRSLDQALLTSYAVRRSESMSLVEKSVLSAIPVTVLLLYALWLARPESRETAVAMVQENRPVELLTFLFLMSAGIHGVRLARRLWSEGWEPVVWLFFAAFGAGMLLIGMEEVAWGQHFLGFDTPEALDRINQQGEVTLHNIGRLQGKSEIFRLGFGAAGVFGIWLFSRPRWRAIGVPPLLWGWFAVIVLASLVDLHNDLYPVNVPFYDEGWRWLSEVVEMLIGAAALLYILVKAQILPPAQGLRGSARSSEMLR